MHHPEVSRVLPIYFCLYSQSVSPNVKLDGDNVTIYTAHLIAKNPAVALTEGGMLLLALLVGGDYSKVSMHLPDLSRSTD